MSRFDVKPCDVVVQAVWVPEGNDEIISYVENTNGVFVSHWYDCLPENIVNSILLAKFCEMTRHSFGDVVFCRKKDLDILSRDTLVKAGAELYTVPVHGLPETFAAIWLETLTAENGELATANPFYTEDVETFWRELMAFLIEHGRSAFECNLYFYDTGVQGHPATKKWEIGFEPSIMGNNFVARFEADQDYRELDDFWLESSDTWVWYQNVAFASVFPDNKGIPEVSTWFVSENVENVGWWTSAHAVESFITHHFIAQGIEGVLEFNEGFLPTGVTFIKLNKGYIRFCLVAERNT